MCTLLTCFDLKKCEEWLTEKEIVTRKRDLIRYDDFHCLFNWTFHTFSAKRSYASENLLYLHQMMKMGTFTETEFYALIVIAFCDMGKIIKAGQRYSNNFIQIQRFIFPIE